MQTKMLINGELVDGDAEAIPVLNPSNGETVALIGEASPQQIEAAAIAAQEAFETYRFSTPAERAAHLLAVADVIAQNIEELSELETIDVGKPWPMARDEEMPLTIDTFRFMAGAARTRTGSATGEYVADHTSMIRKDPIGPVASIAPWNYPLMMAAWKISAPLAAGCTMVLKPSELTPLATLRLAELLADVLPKGVFNVIHGRGETVGEALINDPRMEGISITGSPATGMAAMRAASNKIRHVHLELGGKAPVIAFDDCDVQALAETIRYGSYFNAGQDCAQPCRVLALEGVYDKLLEAVSDQVGQIQIGTPKSDVTEMGPIVSANQRERVAGFVERARGAAEIAVG
ncbi:MAG: aldehyde dehydrogenase family protein, partial [Pseudomonadota bacterium]